MMAFAMRGAADRDTLSRYVESQDVPASWREGALKVTLGGNTVASSEADDKSATARKPKARGG